MLDRTDPRYANVSDRLEHDVVAWLGTVRADGRPHMVAVWFLWRPESGTVLVFSKPGQQKVRNIERNPNVVLSLDDTDDGEDPVTFDGRAELLNDPAVSTTLEAYVAKYGKRIQGIGLDPASMAALYSQAILITPTKFY